MLLTRFTRFFQQHGHSPGGPYLLAVSGGIDSVVLCELAFRSGMQFGVAHCNFQLRGGESERDEAFVRRIAERYSCPYFIQRFDTALYAAENKLSVQEAARRLRYEWFDEVRAAHGYHFTLVAQHADDNIETLLMNFFRGTGLQGLAGMQQRHDIHVLRPLLEARRADIAAFAEKEGLEWVEDSSNATTDYTRNFFRLNILPGIRSVFPAVEENLLNNIDRFRKTLNLYEQLVVPVKKRMLEPFEDGWRIPVLKLLQYRDSSLPYEIIKDFGFGEKQVAELLRLADADSGRFIENDRFRIIRHRKWFVIAPVKTGGAMKVIRENDNHVVFDGGVLHFKIVSRQQFTIDPSPDVAQVDARHLQYPLVLRRWKAGDYFYPLGMRRKKKLARFFIDQKLAKNQKENSWVLESANRIVWVAGMRIDDRFRVSDNTLSVVVITWEHQRVAGSAELH